MRTRNGYVSNSSSSSFIVLLGERNFQNTVTDSQEQMLFGNGFRYLDGRNWEMFLARRVFLSESKDSLGDDVAMKLEVPCNEEEIEETLFGGNIPFVESKEYGKWLVHYDGNGEHYDEYVNAGNIILMGGFSGTREQNSMCRSMLAEGSAFHRIRISDGSEVEIKLDEQEN